MSFAAITRLRTGEISLTRGELDARWKERVAGIPIPERDNWQDPDVQPYSKAATDYHLESWQHHLLKARQARAPYDGVRRRSHWQLTPQTTPRTP